MSLFSQRRALNYNDVLKICEVVNYRTHKSNLPFSLSVLSTGNGLGDPCDGDFDGDKVTDYEDACSINHHVTRTDFSRLQEIDLSPFESSSAIKPPIWAVDSTVRIT